jgi:phosphate starvation-inducible PhoH-like protein|tara:strand:- start:3848 stop:4651 length:804 start_codon:yes stop_codon:yes gene_type:complete
MFLTHYKENTLSKRKTSALRKQEQDTRFYKKNDTQTYYMNESKTISFDQSRTKPNKHVQLVPKSINQEKYILALLDNSMDIVVSTGPAGTGKTYLAMQAAIKALRAGECDKVILTRPAVGVDDEKHGFLPGDLTQKMEPWTRPLIDVLREYYSAREITHMLDEQIVEIAPLAFCRGRNFKNSWVVLDEAQNATPGQLKMIMTRIGVGSKIVITGDIEQADRKNADNGLLDLHYRLQNNTVPGLCLCEFEVKDVQRHKIIPHILSLYS